MAKEGKKKKSLFKRWWFWVVVVIVIGGIGSAASGGGSKSASSSTSSNNTSTNTSTTTKSTSSKTSTKATTTTAQPSQPTAKTYKIGDTVTVGKMVYTINKVSTASQVGPSVAPTKASGKYIVLDVTATNKGDEAVTIDSSYFKLMEGKKTFEADDMASMSANQDDNGDIKNSFFMQQLNPESKASGKIVFDVAPPVASAKDLQVQAQEGMFGANTAIINLQ